MNDPMKAGILSIIGVFVIFGGAYYLHTTLSQTASSGGGDLVKSFSLIVRQRTVVAGDTTLTVKLGDTVSIIITADESDELHLHGYDKSVEFASGTPATLTFTADKSGRFPFEMEGSKTDLGELDVEP